MNILFLFLLVACGSEKEETQKPKNIEYTFTPTDFHSCKALRAQILCPQYPKNHIAS